MAIECCVKLKDIQAKQWEILGREFEKHKWVLSERAQGDVGEEVTQKDYLTHHFYLWAQSFRKHFCEHDCEYVSHCLVYERLVKAREDVVSQ